MKFLNKRKQQRCRRKITLGGLLAFFLVFSVASTEIHAAGSEKISTPTLEAKSAILIEANTGRILYEKNSHELLAMASTTKIMTGLLTLESADLDEIVVVSENAAKTSPVKMGLQKGEEITLRTLLYALMLQSSNDAAVAIAEHIGGDLETFCEMMTVRAKEMGAIDTEFRTPNGLDAESHYSTAYDLGQIAKEAVKNDKFMHIIGSPSYQEASSIQTHYITNTNRFLGEFAGAQGIKTGYTGDAGHCFVGAAARDDIQLISVVLASGWGTKGREQKWIDTKKLMNFGFESYSIEPIFLHESQAPIYITVEKAKTDELSLLFTEDIYWPISPEEYDKVRLEFSLSDSINAPIAKGEEVGFATMYIGEEFVKELSLVAAETIDRHDFKTSLEKAINALFSLTAEVSNPIILPEF